MIIRLATLQDALLIFNLTRNLTTPWSMPTVESWLSKSTTKAYIGFHDKEPVCCVLLTVIPPEAEILEITTAPAFRRQGNARDLLTFAFQDLSKFSIKKIFLDVHRNNQAAQSLYHSFSFQTMGERKDYYGPGQDALMYDLCV